MSYTITAGSVELSGTISANSSKSISITCDDYGKKYTIKITYSKTNYYSNSISFPATTESKERPSLFSWEQEKVSGKSFNLLAREWNNFMKTVQLEVEYVGYECWGWSTAKTNGIFTAAIYNEAINILKNQLGLSATIDYVASGETIYAYMLNNIVTELNGAINMYDPDSYPVD